MAGRARLQDRVRDSVRDRVAVVTGGASGMGRLAATRLAAAGAAVAALDVDEAGLAETAEASPAVRAFPCDVTDTEAVDRVVKEVEEELGPVHRVMNAAGIAPSGRALEQPVDVIHSMMAINFGGVVNVTKATMPGMLERQSGEIVQFASLAGWLPSHHLSAYSASKAAVATWTETLAHENRPRKTGVRIACVCPPQVETPLLDQITGGPMRTSGIKPLDPDAVLDAIERALERGKLWVFPGPFTPVLWRVRRFAPGILWFPTDRMKSAR